MKSERKIHRGWVMPFVCMIMVSATSLLSTGMSTCLNAVKGIYRLSGTATSMIMTVRAVSAFLVMFAAEKYFSWLGVRKGTAIAMFFGTAAFLFFSIGNGNIVIYYIAAALGGITYAFGLMLPVSILLERWFFGHRGLALSIASAGTGFCSLFGAPILQEVITKKSLEAAFIYQAIFLFVVGALLWTVLVDRPADVGLEPVQGKIEEKKIKRRLYSNASTGGLYALLLAAILMGMNSSPASSHLTLNFTTDGFDAMVVARAISLYGFTLILAKLVYGQVVDKLGSKTAVLFFGFLIILARIMCWAATYTDSISFLFLTLFIYGSGVPIETLGYPNWCADLTSSEMYPKVITKLQMGYQLGTLLGLLEPGNNRQPIGRGFSPITDQE